MFSSVCGTKKNSVQICKTHAMNMQPIFCWLFLSVQIFCFIFIRKHGLLIYDIFLNVFYNTVHKLITDSRPNAKKCRKALFLFMCNVSKQT